MTKKQSNDLMRKEVAVKIVMGEVPIQDVEYLFNGEALSINRVVQSVDFMSDGSIRKHETTREEVLVFVTKHPQYDELMETIKTERKKYSQRVDRARKARTKVGKSAKTDTDKHTPSLDNESADVTAQLSASPTPKETAQIEVKVVVDSSKGVETSAATNSPIGVTGEPSHVKS